MLNSSSLNDNTRIFADIVSVDNRIFWIADIVQYFAQMSKSEVKSNVISLRRKELSIKDIALRSGVSRSTVSLWCRGILLSSEQSKILRQKMIERGHRGRMIAAEMNRMKRIMNIRQHHRSGKEEIGELTHRDLLMIGSVLYWAEGSKTGSKFLFVNSDPTMVKIMYKFLKEIFKVDKSRFVVTVQINEIHLPRIAKVLRFWSTLLDLPLSQFNRPYYIKVKPKKTYANHDSYYGILRLSIRKRSDLQYRTHGLIAALRQK